MDAISFLHEQFAEHAAVQAITADAIAEPFGRLVKACTESMKAGGKLIMFGNGGSAADAQHLAAEIVVRYSFNRRALAALALTTDSSVLTACANDFSYDDVFARQIEALARPGDVCLAFSTSGNSPNIVKALQAAKSVGAVAAAFGGRDGGAMKGLADPLLIVPTKVTARIQEMHILLGHSLCDLLERGLAG